MGAEGIEGRMVGQQRVGVSRDGVGTTTGSGGGGDGGDAPLHKHHRAAAHAAILVKFTVQ